MFGNRFKLGIVLLLCFSLFPMNVFANTNNEIYSEIKNEYPNEIDMLEKEGASKTELISFIDAVETKLRKTENLSEDNFKSKLSDTLFSLYLSEQHATVFNAVFTGWDITGERLMVALQDEGNNGVLSLLPDSFLEIGRLVKEEILTEQEPLQNPSAGPGGVALEVIPNITEVKKKIIASENTTIELKDILQIFLPAGSLLDGQEIVLKVLQDKDLPRDYSDAGQFIQAFEVSADRTHKLDRDATLIVHIPKELREGKESAIFYYNEQRKKWMYIGGTVDSQAGNIMVNINHFSTFAVFQISNENRFIDLPRSHWAFEHVNRLVELGTLNGMGNGLFAPNGNVTRAQFAKMISSALDLPKASDGQLDIFADNKEIPDWAKEFVASAVQAGIIQGKRRGDVILFAPDEWITRAEMAVIISRIISIGSIKEVKFTDLNQIPSWALEGIKSSYSSGIITGTPDNQFHSYEKTNRAQAAVVIGRLLYCLGL